jgi:hypothetical protein
LFFNTVKFGTKQQQLVLFFLFCLILLCHCSCGSSIWVFYRCD